MDEKLKSFIGKIIKTPSGETSKIIDYSFSIIDKIPLFHLENGYVLNAEIAKDEQGTFIFS